MDDRKPSYYAVIPADVRYDEQLKPNAKLLYGEISALIGADGFCYASNAYFSNLYGLTDRTISDLISALKAGGYIHLEYNRDPAGQILGRKIYIKVSAPEEQPHEENFYTPGKSFREGIEENFQDTNLSNTVDKKKNRKKKPDPLTDEEMHPLFVDWIRSVASPDWSRDVKNELFALLGSFYDPNRGFKKGSPPVRSKRGFNSMSKNLLKYSNGDPLEMQILLNTAIAQGWVGIYPPNNGSTSRKAAPQMDEGVYKCL